MRALWRRSRPWCLRFRRHFWIWPGLAEGPRYCENCGALRGAALTPADVDELLFALRASDDVCLPPVEAKLLAFLGSAEAAA